MMDENARLETAARLKESGNAAVALARSGPRDEAHNCWRDAASQYISALAAAVGKYADVKKGSTSNGGASDARKVMTASSLHMRCLMNIIPPRFDESETGFRNLHSRSAPRRRPHPDELLARVPGAVGLTRGHGCSDCFNHS